MNEKFYLKALPKMETELNLIKVMVDVAIYERNISETPNQDTINAAEIIIRTKTAELFRVLNNPSRYDDKKDLI